MVVRDDGQPVAGMELSVMLNAGKRPASAGEGRIRTDPQGRLDFPVALLNAPKTAKIDVWVIRCIDGREELVLAAPGEGSPSDEEDCDRTRIGAFPLGGERVVIDVSTGEIATGDGVEGPKAWSFGFAFDYLHFDNWDVACGLAGLTSCDADGSGYGFAAFLDHRFPGTAFGLGGESSYGRAPDVRLDGTSFASEVQTTVWGFAPYALFYWRLAGHRFRALAGGEYLWNSAEFETTPVNGSDGFASGRDEGNWNGLFGTELDIPITDRWAAVLGVRYSTSFGDDDADSGIWRFRLGLRDP